MSQYDDMFPDVDAFGAASENEVKTTPKRRARATGNKVNETSVKDFTDQAKENVKLLEELAKLKEENNELKKEIKMQKQYVKKLAQLAREQKVELKNFETYAIFRKNALSSNRKGVFKLNDRERKQVVKLHAEGFKNTQIAKLYNVSEGTIRNILKAENKTK